ncbi:NADP-dependent oxidoreductase [Parahaliea aestuarii]|uniref:NADP-dependent oxidoreductase n=1 Tax=Parahaliea aestuarii TaxID=1852021 RepID=A0A5C9A2F7_9GAMM|nr:NADP-dependent oxidoreductase [Parahaliea aestuarii]TXS95063.1 NADP-dependent oxidoreductase [Parahaliea aestuarii]
MQTSKNRQFILHQRPAGTPTTDDVVLEEHSLAPLAAGQVRVRNAYFSLDPAIRGWMDDTPSYLPPIELGTPVRSTTVGEVVESLDPDFQPGDKVVAMGAWEEFSTVPGAMLSKVQDDNRFPLHYYANILGAVGLTPYFGVMDAGKPKPGDTLLMSAAAGAVGSVGGQIAKLAGCRVVGLAGSDEKCDWIISELGFDAAINYKTCGLIADAIARACPAGVDIYFDNVGGEILDGALLNLNSGARIVFCGAISGYNSAEPVPGPYNWWQILARSVTVQGYLVSDYVDRFPEGIAQMGEWVEQGKIKFREEIVDGFENTFSAFLKLFDGSNAGKLILRL